MKEVTSAKVAQTTIITGDSNVSRRPTNLQHTLTRSYDNPQNTNMHGTPIRWAYYSIFRAANAPDLGLTAVKKLERLRSIYKFAAKRKFVEENYALDLETPKVEPNPTLPFTEEQMRKS